MSAGKKIGVIAFSLYTIVVFTCLFLGSAVGVGTYTFYYAQGGSYFSDSSTSCANCHIMQEHYDAWVKSSHHDVAQCNDCHSPPGNLPEKLFCKGLNGFNHSVAFTLGTHKDQLSITDFNRKITERSCRKCHEDLTHGIEIIADNAEQISCIRCHGSVGHPTR